MPHRAVARAVRRLGRRGVILSCYGAVWALYGYALVVEPLPDRRGLRFALHLMPLEAWAWAWLAAGFVALAAAWLPSRDDWWGFLVLLLTAVPWSLSYLLAWWWGDVPRGWVAAAIWGLIVAPVLVVAGWPEPPRPKGK